MQPVARPSPQTERVVALARLLAAHPEEGFTITELAKRLRMNKATFYPMLVALTEAGWVVRDPTLKTYQLGPELIALGAAAGRSLPAVQLARPTMVELATELGVTCAAFTASDGIATLVDQVWDVRSTVQPLRVGLWAPVKAPFGAVFAAWGNPEERAAWLAEIEPAKRPRFVAALDAIRDRGYAVELRTPARWADGTGSLAALLPADIADQDFLLTDVDPKATYTAGPVEAPMLDRDGRVAVALVLVGLPRTMKGGEIDALGTRLVAAVRT